jgi:hypothetical protein
MMKSYRLIATSLALAVVCSCSDRSAPDPQPTLQRIRLQLNWFHDPSFAGEYIAAKKQGVPLNILQGGPNISAPQILKAGQADVAIMGADIFLRTVSEDLVRHGESQLIAFHVDFQRNPVGWILHPEVARRLRLDPSRQDAKQRNDWFFEKVRNGELRVGDKRGTETTSIWVRWRALRQLPNTVTVVPVGFDPDIVLSKPALAFPVYLNEEPWKLGERIGEPVVVFDPAADGIAMYGNVLVTTRAFLASHPDQLRLLQKRLAAAWNEAKANPGTAVTAVSEVYKGVSQRVLEQQVQQTLDFVFFGNSVAGAMDANDNGRWSQTLSALTEAKMVDGRLTIEILRRHLHPHE